MVCLHLPKLINHASLSSAHNPSLITHLSAIDNLTSTHLISLMLLSVCLVWLVST